MSGNAEALVPLLAGWQGSDLLVVGDFMLDQAQHRHPQKMFRVDVESRDPISGEIEARLLAAIERAAKDCQVICLEDYAKGVCTPTLCQGVIDIGTEAALAAGRKTMPDFDPAEVRQLARTLRERYRLAAVVLTLDRHGSFLEREGTEPVHVPTVARRVYDVTGAGDMVLAALAAALANGFPWPEAVAFANVAAGLEVEVFGARPIPFAQVRRQVLAQAGHMAGKIRDRQALRVELEARREAGQRIVLTNGCFDVLHAGHVSSLRAAREQGDLLVVAVNSDASVRELKGEDRPVFPLAQRMEVLAALESVDLVVAFEERSAHEVIRLVHPHVYVKGGDYRRPEDVAEHALLVELGVELRLLGHVPGVSTTAAIHRMRERETGTIRG